MTHDRADDMILLEMLHLRATTGMSHREIGRKFGRSKNAVIGALHRINKEADAVSCRCRRKHNRDGGMPAMWWAEVDYHRRMADKSRAGDEIA